VSGILRRQGTTLGGQDVSGPLRHAWLVVAGTTSSGRHITRHLTTNRWGHFGLYLPAGRYAIAVGQKLRTPLDHQTHVWATVRPHHLTHVRIVEDVL
jgi:hypothetical protein